MAINFASVMQLNFDNFAGTKNSLDPRFGMIIPNPSTGGGDLAKLRCWAHKG
jgi:hypothetical protein